MTDAEISALTLGDLERIAERFGGAVKQIRDAQAMLISMGAGPQRLVVPSEAMLIPVDPSEVMPPDEDPVAAHRRRQFQPVEMGQPRGLRSPVKDPLRHGPTAADIAERNRLMGRSNAVDPNLPDEIAVLEREG